MRTLEEKGMNEILTEEEIKELLEKEERKRQERFERNRRYSRPGRIYATYLGDSRNKIF